MYCGRNNALARHIYVGELTLCTVDILAEVAFVRLAKIYIIVPALNQHGLTPNGRGRPTQGR